MKNKIFTLIVLFSLAFAACEKREINLDSHEWGRFERFDDFPVIPALKPYLSDTLYKTLRFEFNHHSRGEVTDVKLQLFERVAKRDPNTQVRDTVYSIPKGVVLLKNGVRCEDNILTITPQDEKVQIGLVFTNETEVENHRYSFVLKVLDSGGLDRIDNIAVSADSRARTVYLADEWVVRKKKVYNPLLFGVLIGLGVLLTCLGIWRFIIRPKVHTTFIVKKLTITYQGTQPQTVRLVKRGFLFKQKFVKLVCTNEKPKSQLLSKFWCGEIAYERNKFWEKKVEVIPIDKNTVHIECLPNPPFSIQKGTSSVIAGVETYIKNSNTNSITKLRIN